MSAATVHVDLPGRDYDIHIGPGVLDQVGGYVAAMGGRRHVCILTDETVAGLHLNQLQTALTAAGLTSEALALPPGEATKCWAQLQRAVEWLLEQKVERGDVVVAFGGGVIGDLAGVCGRYSAPWRAVCATAHDIVGAGGQFSRRQDRHQFAPWQEPDRRIPSAEPCFGRYRSAGYIGAAGFACGLW